MNRRHHIILFAAGILVAGASSALAAALHVDINSTNATPPFTNWSTAATNIQDAVDAAVAGDEIVVTNGIYASGGRDYNRLKVDKPLSVRSVNGPQFTAITGGGTNRCVYLTNSASLSGFTLTNGAAGYGGGVFCESFESLATVSNCVVTCNSASSGSGGGAVGVTLNDCTLTGNWVNSPAAYGGGAFYSTLNNCLLSDNHAQGGTYGFGGGAYRCTLNNCALTRNSATCGSCPLPRCPNEAFGGGAYDCTLHNCTLSGNLAMVGAGLQGNSSGGGAYICTLNNCISFDNYAQDSCEDCHTLGLLYGNNWYGDPLFVDTNGWANLRLQSNSPCINAGNNAYAPASPDLDGNARIVGGTVDIGAYEFQSPVSQISYAWLQQYGLPINSSTDTADPDGDAVDNYHEWLAGTDPTNPLSSPAQLTISPSGLNVVLTWSTNAIGFALQSTANLGVSAAWVTNSLAPVVIAGQNTVTNPITAAQKFYRLIR